MSSARGALAPYDIAGMLASATQKGTQPKGLLDVMPEPGLRGLLGQMIYDAANSVGLGSNANRMRNEASAIVDLIPGVGEAVGADDARRSFNAGNYGQAAFDAGTTLLGSVPVGGDLAAGVAKAIFGGIGAKTADMAMLNKAAKMKNDGANRDAIWNETGWFKGQDDQWRFEIDDHGAFTKGFGPMSKIAQEQGSNAAPSVMRHPELWSAYPSLNRVLVQPFENPPDAKGIMKGTYDPNNARLGINESLRGSDMGSTMLHELQHAVQTHEGFARGASPDEYASGAMFHEKARDLQGELSKALTGGLTSKPHEILANAKYIDEAQLASIAAKFGFNSADEALAFLKMQDEMRTPISQYKRTAGEVEARNVQKRMNMTAAERRATPPWATQDVPDELQIVRRR